MSIPIEFIHSDPRIGRVLWNPERQHLREDMIYLEVMSRTGKDRIVAFKKDVVRTKLKRVEEEKKHEHKQVGVS